MAFTHQGAYWMEELKDKRGVTFADCGADESFFEELLSDFAHEARQYTHIVSASAAAKYFFIILQTSITSRFSGRSFYFPFLSLSIRILSASSAQSIPLVVSSATLSA